MLVARLSPLVVPALTHDDPEWPVLRVARATLLTAFGYWIGAKLGMALTPDPQPVASLWPPNSIMLAALLIVPTRYWWIVLLGALPAHLAVELGSGVPMPMVLSWFVSNAFEAALGAGLVRRFSGPKARLDNVRTLAVFVVCASFFAVFVASFLDVGFVELNRWGEGDYWSVWRARFFSNVLATQTIVPVILSCDARVFRVLRTASVVRYVEGVALGAAMTVVCALVFNASPERWHIAPALLFLPIPLLLWAAVRFGMFGVSLGLLGVTVVAIWGVVRGHGPFATPDAEALSVQLFLFLTALPMSALAAVIEERRAAIEEARAGESVLRSSIDAAYIGVWSFDMETQRVWAVGNEEALLGVATEREERPVAEWMDRIVPEDRRQMEKNFELACLPTAPRDENGDTPLPEIAYRVNRGDGRIHWILTRGTVLRRPDGTPYRSTGVNIDITDRLRTAKALEEGKERLELAAAAAKIGFWSIELGSDEMWVSNHCYTLLGMEEGTPEARDAVESLVRATASRGEENGRDSLGYRDMQEYELLIVAADGVERWISAGARRVRQPGGDTIRIIGMIRDITEQRRAEREVRQQQAELTHLSRVSLVGELAAAIVHEVGQPIGAVTLNAQAAERLLERENVSHDMLREIVGEILRDNQRAWSEIRQLRDLVRRAETERERLDMRQVVREALVIARRELSNEDIQVGLVLGDDVPPIMGNKAQLQQVLLNLILNARDAMVDMPPTLRELRVTVEKGEGSTAHVVLADAGSGITPDRADEMFQPFVTSKRHGLGLGLAISRSIVVEHGGALRAEQGAVGAVLHLTLPAADARAD
ncbi:MAG TPA: MASE1 domain-containing protein [Gemmatimonadaceae bacterium]|nr:MASE1 domain-containing protein [Gemmatimonadaceae bacterium]